MRTSTRRQGNELQPAVSVAPAPARFRPLLRRRPGVAARDAHDWQPPVDVIETDDQCRVEVELPGVEAKDVRIRVEDGLLTVSGERGRPDGASERTLRAERRFGKFARRFRLPADATAKRSGLPPRMEYSPSRWTRPRKRVPGPSRSSPIDPDGRRQERDAVGHARPDIPVDAPSTPRPRRPRPSTPARRKARASSV